MASSSSSLDHGLRDGKEYKLNLGSTFFGKPSESYHLMRYDFKPASADTSQPAEVKIAASNECTVTIPNDSGETIYKGGKKPCTKECVLIINKETGEITLERVSSNISLKKSRINKAPTHPSLNKLTNKPTSSPTTSKTAATTNNTQTTTTTKQSTSLNNSLNSSQSGTFSSPAKVHSSNSSTGQTQNGYTSTGQTHNSNTSTGQTHNSNTSTGQTLNNHSNKTTGVKKRGLSSTSTSDSNSSSSDSSDSESETEKEMAAIIEMETFSTKAYQPPPPPPAQVIPPATEPNGMFLSSLHSDLQLSDSNESDSD